MKIISIGSDPEFFVLDKDNKPYPATPFAEGTKADPKAIPSLGSGFFEQRDNLSFEGNIPVCYSKDDFVRNVTLLRNYFLSKVSKFGYSLSPNGVEYFPKRMLYTPEGSEFGCSSVISTWDSSRLHLKTLPTPILSRVPYRVSGFHIHLGIECQSTFSSTFFHIIIGRLFDLFLTIPSHKIKDEPERLLSYGKYGMIRITPYGLECRTLSTFFTQEKYLPWVWDQIKKMELFINECNINDLRYLDDRAFVITDLKSIKQAFSDIFSDFKHKGHFSQFEELSDLNINYGKNDVKQKTINFEEDSINQNYNSSSTSTYNTTTAYYR